MVVCSVVGRKVRLPAGPWKLPRCDGKKLVACVRALQMGELRFAYSSIGVYDILPRGRREFAELELCGSCALFAHVLSARCVVYFLLCRLCLCFYWRFVVREEQARSVAHVGMCVQCGVWRVACVAVVALRCGRTRPGAPVRHMAG